MGTFQITYDDFTGGHYMGDRANNQPSNTWKGQDVILTPRGDLVPVGWDFVRSVTTPLASPTEWGIGDIWLVGANVYVFAHWRTATTFAGRMYQQAIDTTGGTLYTATLTARPNGRVAYDATNSCFYYANSGTIYKVTTGRVETTLSSALSATGVGNCAIAGYRIVTWSTSSAKLYYSNATRTTFATTDYYEFAGTISAVYPRSNDIVVVTSEGVYSMVGVLGSSITIQRILEGSDTKEGMNRAAVIGRSLIFSDSTLSGEIDGSLYELTGATVRQIASLDSTVVIDNLNANPENVLVQNIGNGCIAVACASGEVYVSNPNNTWSLLTFGEPTATTSQRMAISRSGNATRNEFFAIGSMTTNGTLYISRVIYHFPIPAKKNYKFDSTANTYETTDLPVGYATLAEYWHNKPCVVKEVIAEWLIDDKAKTYVGGLGTTGSILGIGATVTPLGCVDVTAGNVPNLTTSTLTDSALGSSYSTGYPIRVTSRLRVDGANKGYGFSVQMTLNACRLRRVVVVCED